MKYFKERSHAWSEAKLLVMCASYFSETPITSERASYIVTRADKGWAVKRARPSKKV